MFCSGWVRNNPVRTQKKRWQVSRGDRDNDRAGQQHGKEINDPDKDIRGLVVHSYALVSCGPQSSNWVT